MAKSTKNSTGWSKPRVIFREDIHITQNLEKSEYHLRPIKEKVEEAAEIAKEIAPVRTGAYRDGIRTDQVLIDGKWISRLIGSDFKSGWIEFGTERMPAFATLRTAMEAAGLHVTDGSKDLRGKTHVKGYTTKSGRKVKGYTRKGKG